MRSCIHRRRSILLPLLSFLIALGMTLVLMIILKLAPFGGNSWVSMDANIQYLDFFAYFKDVLEGKQSVIYSFSHLLGQSGIGLFSYYLASPVNILLFFFNKPDLHSFFDIAVAVKISLSAFTMAVYLLIRFTDKASALLVTALSLCYAFMQYNIAQSSNIMWLDGVYMLPLMMAGVYLAVSERKHVFLSITVGITILFNWYAAGINCLFSFIWFFFEYLTYVQNKNSKGKIFIGGALTYIFSVILGLMMSAVLFLPTIIGLREGKGSSFDWDNLKNVFIGNPLSAVQQYSLGGTSQIGAVSLFCGSIVLIGCIGALVTKAYTLREKGVFCALLFVCFLMFYWQPFYFAFSLFKAVNSYVYRYSYTASFALIVIASWFYTRYSSDESHILLKAISAYVLLFLTLDYIKQLGNEKLTEATVLFIAVNTLLVYAVYSHKNIKIRHIAAAGILIVSMAELFCNAALVTKKYWNTNVRNFESYESAQMDLVDQVKKHDAGTYRISQNMTRRMTSMGSTTANYNESLAFNYNSIEGYTSSLQISQTTFLDHLGYRAEGSHIITVKNTSIIPADALLGVKYTFSPYSVNGLQHEEQYGTVNMKDVYSNPYCLPMAFTVKSSEKFSYDGENPFEYLNKLYSYLLGRNEQIFIPADFSRQDNSYQISIPAGNYALYGNLLWSENMKATLNLNNAFSIPYSQWLSQSVFYVPTNTSDHSAQVSLTSDKPDTITGEQFYLLDLDAFGKVTDDLKNGNTVSDLHVENRRISCTLQAESGQKLFTSIPYERGWTVKANGKIVVPETIDDCLMMIPLQEGKNSIEMTYSIPGLRAGILLSITGILMTALAAVIRWKKA